VIGLFHASGAVAQAWTDWSAKAFTGTNPREDQADPARLNRAIWYAGSDYATPYPGDAKVLTADGGCRAPTDRHPPRSRLLAERQTALMATVEPSRMSEVRG